MEVKINEQDSAVIVEFIGRLDTPASTDASKAIEPVLADAGKTIILECKDLSYISSSGLRIFLTIRKAAASQGGKVIVRNISDDIRHVFMMTGFLNLFEIQ